MVVAIIMGGVTMGVWVGAYLVMLKMLGVVSLPFGGRGCGHVR